MERDISLILMSSKIFGTGLILRLSGDLALSGSGIIFGLLVDSLILHILSPVVGIDIIHGIVLENHAGRSTKSVIDGILIEI